MPILYHGTNRAFATAMAGTPAAGGTVDVTRGRGEFGRGFYTQDSTGNAARRGQGIYGDNSAVLILNIDNLAYHALNFRRLNLNMARRLDAQLRASHMQHAYTTVHDAIIGPLVGMPGIEQQKFQTQNARTLLNGPLTQRTVK
ncbi:MAG TPA: hypothetical protein VK395_20345 [Gemmataceae bacterium]|nr:hypothetical protein [Gemmataceae bacterium]